MINIYIFKPCIDRFHLVWYFISCRVLCAKVNCYSWNYRTPLNYKYATWSQKVKFKMYMNTYNTYTNLYGFSPEDFSCWLRQMLNSIDIERLLSFPLDIRCCNQIYVQNNARMLFGVISYILILMVRKDYNIQQYK